MSQPDVGRISGGVPLLVMLNLAGKTAAWLLGREAWAAALTLWFVPDLLVAYHLFVARAQGVVRHARHFPAHGREVWLTIDDGPDSTDCPQILALLRQHDAKATFFVIGQQVLDHPELVRRVHASGHEIAHHTHTHPVGTFWCASPARLRRELDATLAALAGLGITPTRFRPPAGIKNPWLNSALRMRGLKCIGWSRRGLERQSADPAAVARRVLRDVRPGSILLLHEGPRVPAAIRVEAIRLTLEQLTRLGYRCVVPPPFD